MSKTIAELLALPVPAPKAKAQNTTTSTSTPNLPKLANNPELTEKEIDRRNLSADIADKRAGESLLNATADHAANLAEQAEKAEKAAQDKAKQEAIDVVRLIGEMADHEQALALVRQMAENLGYRLAKIPAKKAA